MKPLVLLLFLSACISQVCAQQDKPDGNAAPAGQNSAEKPALPSAGIPCPHCNQAEQLVVDLIYYKQVLDILEQINQQRDKINVYLLRSVHAELIKTRPNLAALFKTDSEPQARPAPPVKKPAKPVKKQAAPVKKPAPKQGIDGLIVGHVNDKNNELGIKASVVLISNGRPRSLNVGSIIKHNRRNYKIVKVDYVEDRDKGNRHEVHLQELTSKQIHVVPWQ